MGKVMFLFVLYKMGDEDMKENRGLLKIKNDVNNRCDYYDPYELCSIMDCFKCNNSVVRVILQDGSQFGDREYSMRGENEEKYIIIIYDKISSLNDLDSYLLDENSDYQLIRIDDGIIIRNRPVGNNTNRNNSINGKEVKKKTLLKRNKQGRIKG